MNVIIVVRLAAVAHGTLQSHPYRKLHCPHSNQEFVFH
jgi:hypothetical protein